MNGPSRSSPRRLVLAGGGHAQLLVLERFASVKVPDLELILVNPSRWFCYSGMLPGWLAGHYGFSDNRIDLQALADAAGAQFIELPAHRLDADTRYISLADGRQLNYDLLCLDTGGSTTADWLEDYRGEVLALRPLMNFQRTWEEWSRNGRTDRFGHVAVVGGGAAGVEIALAVACALDIKTSSRRISLVTGKTGLIPTMNLLVRKKVRRTLKRAGIHIIEQHARGVGERLCLDDNRTLEADLVIAATSVQAPEWLNASGLALDKDGFLQVDATHRSVSHPEIFAAGDICSRTDLPLEHSGVHAVKAGAVVADNLLASLLNTSLRIYKPRKKSLYLLACGDRRAIASWGPLSAEGRWVWRWKDRIDRNFIERFTYPVLTV